MREPEVGRHWILRNGVLVEAVDVLEWAEWFENTDERIVGADYFTSDRYGMVLVSTVCLGVEHVGGVFETMVFREKGTDDYGLPPPDDLVCLGFWGEMRRYWTLEEAKSGHVQACESIAGVPNWSPTE